MDTLAVLDRLERVRPNAKGGTARCPAHEDRENSLSVSAGDDGRVLLKCFAGCPTDAVVAALGLTMADLFPEPERGPILRANGRAHVTKYEILDRDGALQAIHERHEGADGTKRFVWRQPDGTPGLNGTAVADLPLYGSERVQNWLPGETIVLAEGEKAAVALRDAGMAALGTVCGASSTPSASALAVLTGRIVVLWPDADDAGRAHMDRIGALLDGQAVVAVVDWQDAPAKGDAADFLTTHGKDDLRALVASSRSWAPVSAQQEIPLGRHFRTAREIVNERPPEWRYVSRPWLALGMLTEQDGKPKTAGKTTWLLHLIRAVLDGRPFLGEPTMRTPVVFLTEQSRASIAPTLARLGLDRDDLAVLSWPDALGLTWPQVVALAIEECQRRGARLLVVDTLGQFAGLRGDSENDSGAALEAMAPLQAAAAENDLAVLLSRHDRKGGGDIGESGRGSNAWTGAVDCVISLRRPLNPVRHTIRELEAISRRDDVPTEPITIELVDDEYVLLDSAAVAFDEARHRLLAQLTARPQTEAEILAAVAKLGGTLSRSTFQRARDALLQSGDMTRVGSGKAKDPYRYRSAHALSAHLPLSAQHVDVGQTDMPALKLSIPWSAVSSGDAS